MFDKFFLLEKIEKKFLFLPIPVKNLIRILVRKGLMYSKKSETYPSLELTGNEEVKL